MRYVILRDDDTNALTPISHLETLYRPFLDAGQPVNLATIPNVRTDVTYGDGIPEGFLVAKNGETRPFVPLADNPQLVRYLKANPGYHIVQHGCHHEFVNRQCEFDHHDRQDIARRLDEGRRWLAEAGFESVNAFVAPYDRLTRVGWEETASRFPLVSTGWFELGRLPRRWWPGYAMKKVRRQPHWRAGSTILLSHPGCHLSYHRPYDAILDQIRQSIRQRRLTVLVTHWWEYFPNNQPDQAFIDVLHETSRMLAADPEIQVVTFDDVAKERVPVS